MPKKRNSKRKVLPVFYVFCEGEKTEPHYLEHYVKEHCSTCVRGRFKLKECWKIAKTNRTDPNSLVMLAVKQQANSPRGSGDRFWCVYDRESECGISSAVHYKALKLAEENGIQVAISNVCFEVWLLLHKQPTCAPYTSCEDLLKRSKLNEFFNGYKKGMGLSFTDEEICAARKAAACLGIPGASESLSSKQIVTTNPSTNVYGLLDAIDAFFEHLTS